MYMGVESKMLTQWKAVSTYFDEIVVMIGMMFEFHSIEIVYLSK